MPIELLHEKTSHKMSTVLISGASGFVAAHTVQQLIQRGYNVVGTVRSVEKGEYVKKLSGNSDKFSYEIVKDLAAEGAFSSRTTPRLRSFCIQLLHSTSTPHLLGVTCFNLPLKVPNQHCSRSRTMDPTSREW